MQEEVKVWLEDIEKAIAEINNFLPEPRNFHDFEKDIKTPIVLVCNEGGREVHLQCTESVANT